MRRAFGTITKRGPNVWRVQWGSGYSDGKRNRRSATVRGTRKDAEDFLEAQGEVGHAITWDRFYSFYVVPTYDGLADKTVIEYERLWERHLRPYIGRKRVSDTGTREVDSVLSMVGSPTVQRAVKALWRKACRIAVRKGILSRCPIDEQTPLKRHEPKRKRLLDPTELEWWMGLVRGFKCEASLLCMLGAGLRVEEACALTWEDFREEEVYRKRYMVVTVSKALVVAGKCKLKDTKNGFSEREVIVPDPFASRLWELEGKGPLQPSASDSGYLSPSTMTHLYRALCDGHPYVRPKDLRGTYATWHGEAGTPDSLVSASMGHSDGTTKGRHYQQLTLRGLALVADSMESYLGRFKTPP